MHTLNLGLREDHLTLYKIDESKAIKYPKLPKMNECKKIRCKVVKKDLGDTLSSILLCVCIKQSLM